MIRKQLYIEEAQDKALKRRAKELGVTEAEVVRRALDEALREEPYTAPQKMRLEALERLLQRADALAKTHSFPEGYRLNRQELYEEDRRFTKWGAREEAEERVEEEAEKVEV